MKVIILPVGQMGTNCYLIEDNGDVGIIDPGDSGDFIIRKIQDLEATPVWVAATHGHFDHLVSVSEIALTYEIPFYLNSRDEFLLKHAKQTAEYFLGIPADPILVEPKRFPQKEISVGNIDLQIIEIPGHTPGSVCLYSIKEKVLFCGDLIFTGGGIGRTDFKYCSDEDLKKSIKKILKLPEDVVIYPGHGEETSVMQARIELKGII